MGAATDHTRDAQSNGTHLSTPRPPSLVTGPVITGAGVREPEISTIRFRGFARLVTVAALARPAHDTVELVPAIGGTDIVDSALQDLRRSAIALDAGESAEIRTRALRQTARAAGRQDVIDFVADRRARGLAMAELERVLSEVDAVISHDLALPRPLQEAYRDGVVGAAALLYVRVAHPSAYARSRALAAFIIASDSSARAEFALTDAIAEQSPVDPTVDLDAFALAAEHGSRMLETAEWVASRQLGRRVADVAMTHPELETEVLVKLARASARVDAAATDGEMLRRGYEREAWQAVPMTELEACAIEGRSRHLTYHRATEDRESIAPAREPERRWVWR